MFGKHPGNHYTLLGSFNLSSKAAPEANQRRSLSATLNTFDTEVAFLEPSKHYTIKGRTVQARKSSKPADVCTTAQSVGNSWTQTGGQQQISDTINCDSEGPCSSSYSTSISLSNSLTTTTSTTFTWGIGVSHEISAGGEYPYLNSRIFCIAMPNKTQLICLEQPCQLAWALM
jgi:hypothetical protein